jgi:hypothetical protein
MRKIILKLAIVLGIFLNPASAKNYSKPYPQYQQTPPSSYEPSVAENGSYRGQYSERTHRPKNDHAHGYNRKDGTHVRGHYRSRRR